MGIGRSTYLCDNCQLTPWYCQRSSCYRRFRNKESPQARFKSKKELYEHYLNKHDREWYVCPGPADGASCGPRPLDATPSLRRVTGRRKCDLPHRFRLCDEEAKLAHEDLGCLPPVPTTKRMLNRPIASNRRLIERFIRESIRCQNA